MSHISGMIPPLMKVVKDTVRYFEKRQFKVLNEHIRIVRILQAEEYQGQILFFNSAFIYVKSSSFLHGKAPPRKQMRLIAYWKSWKDICTYCLPASILHAQKKPMVCRHTPILGPILLLLKVTESSHGFTRKAITVFASKIKPFESIPMYLNNFRRLQHSSRKAQVTTDAN